MLLVQSFGLFKALNIARAFVVMPFIVTIVIFGNLFGYLLFGEVLDMIEISGTILIIAMSIYQIVFVILKKV